MICETPTPTDWVATSTEGTSENTTDQAVCLLTRVKINGSQERQTPAPGARGRGCRRFRSVACRETHQLFPALLAVDSSPAVIAAHSSKQLVNVRRLGPNLGLARSETGREYCLWAGSRNELLSHLFGPSGCSHDLQAGIFAMPGPLNYRGVGGSVPPLHEL